MSLRLSSEKIKAEAESLGFFACGIAKAEPVEEGAATMFDRWIELGCHAEMAYMAANRDKRLDPGLLMEGVKSIVSVAMNYAPHSLLPDDGLHFAAYSLGRDYHDVVKSRLHLLASRLQLTNYRAFCDTAPVLERYWAERSGLGWVGRNRQLIIPGAGSMFFLGELFVDEELDYDEPAKNRCGCCHACIDACPTGALGAVGVKSCDNRSGNKENVNSSYDEKAGMSRCESIFDAGKCLSYLTIENRGELPGWAAAKMGNTVYGCDRCQQACPWNRFAVPTDIADFMPSEALLAMTRERWSCLSVEDYRRLFKGSAVKRVKYEGLMRNIRAVTGCDNVKPTDISEH